MKKVRADIGDIVDILYINTIDIRIIQHYPHPYNNFNRRSALCKILCHLKIFVRK